RYQLASVALRIMDVMGSAGLEHLLLLLGQLAHHLARAAHHQAAIRDDLAFGNQAVGANDAVLADLGAVEDHRVDADQAVIVHRAAVHHHVVTDGDALAQGQRKAHVGVHDATVLHVAVLSDMDQLVVATQHRTEPDTGPRLQADIADQVGAWCNPAIGMGIDTGASQAVFHARQSSSLSAQVYEVFGRLVQGDPRIVEDQVDQLHHHDRGEPPDAVLAIGVGRHVPAAPEVIDTVSHLARVIAEELQRYRKHRGNLRVVGLVLDEIRHHSDVRRDLNAMARNQTAEWPDHFNQARRQADFFIGLTQRGIHQIAVFRITPTAGEGNL